MKTLIEQIAKITTLAIPKSLHNKEQIISAFGGTIGDTTESWLVPCFHSLNAPAQAEHIIETEKQLGYSIPAEYKQFLSVSNGAKLFNATRNRPQTGSPHIRYHLFSCDELLKINRFMLQTFLEAYADDPEFEDVRSLNYMAFCDATNDNYQAVVIDSQHRNRVFLLFYEFQCRPYSELDSDFYYSISESIESWLKLILITGGWGGRGWAYAPQFTVLAV